MKGRKGFTKSWGWVVAGAAVVLAAVFVAYQALVGGGVPTMGEIPLLIAAKEPLPLYEGEQWQPDGREADSDGFVEALDNGLLALRIHPVTTQIKIIELRTGAEWRSNPAEQALEQESVKGMLLSNLRSPFILEYTLTGASDMARRELANAAHPDLQVTMARAGNGLQISYDFTDLQLRFILQYELAEDGMRVHVPRQGIKEGGTAAILTIDLLPFLGASQAGEEGYFLVPDGPGGLIRFDRERTHPSLVYLSQIYGNEISHIRSNSSLTQDRIVQEGSRYPVFGAKRADAAYLAVVERGSGATSIKALPPGARSSYYSINAQLVYREEFLRKRSRMSAPVKMVEKSLVADDRTILYMFLADSEADYVGMGRAYQAYLLSAGQLGQALPPTQHVPLDLGIIGGDASTSVSKASYIAATTFEQAGLMVSGLKAAGVDNMRVIYYGWQQGGTGGATPFPIEQALGGQQAAKQFIEGVHQLGGKVMFENDFVVIDPKRASIAPKSNAVRGIDGTVYFAPQGEFILKPELTAGYAYLTMQKLKELGVDGIHYSRIGELTYREFDPAAPHTRTYTEQVYTALLHYSREQFSMNGLGQGNAYTLGATDYLTNFASDPSYHMLVDETVPFYPLALHGYVSYSMKPGNLRDEYEQEFLKAIEYGAVPAFTLTYERSRVLKKTASSFLFSSEFVGWKERVAEEYKAFDQLAGVYHQRLVGHEQLAPQVYATTYEDGTQVIVDYRNQTFEVKEGGELDGGA